MPCYHPLDAWIHPTKKTDNGKKLLLFKYDPKVCNSPSPDLQLNVAVVSAVVFQNLVNGLYAVCMKLPYTGIIAG